MSQDLRTQKTRASIEGCLLSLLEHYPFQEITVKMLIEGCQINRSTFYRNYEDKYALIAQIASRLLEEFGAALHPEFVIEPNWDDKQLRFYFSPLVEYFGRNKKVLLVMRARDLPVNLFEEMLDLYSDRIFQVLKRHYGSEGYSSQLAGYFAKIIASNILTAILWWHEEVSEKEEADLLQLISTTVSKGIFQSMEQQLSKAYRSV